MTVLNQTVSFSFGINAVMFLIEAPSKKCKKLLFTSGDVIR